MFCGLGQSRAEGLQEDDATQRIRLQWSGGGSTWRYAGALI